ncbi:hypothetical protein GCM10010466_29740 [Planomonospora alba]|uniref:Uncharacterized protein n=1 Tax=Planomonospora alba TaxID=161354 RepID=A0ABP6N7T1_9ACTN
MTFSRQRVSREDIRRLIASGKPYGDIATELGCSYSTVAHAARELGFGRALLSHKNAIPWKLRREHQKTMPADYLRELSRMEQGRPATDPYKRATAVSWAQRLLEQGLDVSYDPKAGPSEFCPAGGFHTVDASDAPPLETHIGKLLDAAIRNAPVRA